MTITYEEFDSTPATLIAALKTKILANTHWTDQGVVAVSTTSTGATVAAQSTVTLTSAAGFVAGQWIVVNPGTSDALYQVSSIAGNVLTVVGTWGVIFASGSTFRTRNTVLKSTSDRGVDLIVDLEGGGLSGAYIGTTTYRAYAGTAPGGHTDSKNYWLYWKTSGAVMTVPLHVTLSVGKNHLFFAIEGPRPFETGPTSTTYGSIKNYFAVCDLVPYHAADTTGAVIGISGSTNGASTPAVSVANSHQVAVSRDFANTASWQPGRLASLDWPTIYTTDVVTMNRTCTIDGNTYLFPYVMVSEAEGIRGRLSTFFYCGTTSPSPVTDFPDPVGTKVSYGGIVYKLVAVNKGDGTSVAWGPFGSVANNGAITRSIIVAVPFAVAV
jgi:hypothetical protein